MPMDDVLHAVPEHADIINGIRWVRGRGNNTARVAFGDCVDHSVKHF